MCVYIYIYIYIYIYVNKRFHIFCCFYKCRFTYTYKFSVKFMVFFFLLLSLYYMTAFFLNYRIVLTAFRHFRYLLHYRLKISFYDIHTEEIKTLFRVKCVNHFWRQ